MKLLRVGDLGKEKVAAIDKNNIFRDLYSHISDLNPDTLKLNNLTEFKKIKLEDLPDDLKVENVENLNDWTKVLQQWSENYLAKGKNNLLEEAIPEFEKTIIKVALNKTMGRKKEAAELLGWGRNTLTRKIKELGLDN